jgi:predicted porin
MNTWRLVLASVLCLPLAAQAQSGVTVYGLIDQFLTRLHADGLPATTRIDSSGFLASRIGVRGSETLGAGLRTSFVLEAGANPDDGSAADANRLFNRLAWIAVQGEFGELRVGRQNTPQFTMNGRFDAFASGTQASGWNNLLGQAPRADNAVAYFSPALHGWKLQAMVGRGATGGAAPLSEENDNGNLHFGAEFENERHYVGGNVQIMRSAATAQTLRREALATSCKLNARWTVYGAVGRERRSDHGIEQRIYGLSALYQLAAPSVIAIGIATIDDRLQGTGHGDASESSMQYRHKLSNRTMIYAAASHLAQQGSRNNLVLGGGAVVAASARIQSRPGGAIRATQLGIVHSF